MSVNVKLIIEGKTINVLHSKYGFKQGSDENGYPCEKTRFLGLELLIEASKDADFFDWSTQSNLMKQLELHYIPRIMGGKTRKLSFVDCHCLEHETHFDAHSDKPMTERLFISAAGVKTSYSTEEYSAYWRKTFEDKAVDETVREEEEKKITRYFLSDPNGTEITEYKEGDTIILNIETSNRIGDRLSINLDDAEYDFKYQGNLIPNDTLKNIVIGNDIEKVELKVVEQKTKN